MASNNITMANNVNNSHTSTFETESTSSTVSGRVKKLLGKQGTVVKEPNHDDSTRYATDDEYSFLAPVSINCLLLILQYASSYDIFHMPLFMDLFILLDHIIKGWLKFRSLWLYIWYLIVANIFNGGFIAGVVITICYYILYTSCCKYQNDWILTQFYCNDFAFLLFSNSRLSSSNIAIGL